MTTISIRIKSLWRYRVVPVGLIVALVSLAALAAAAPARAAAVPDRTSAALVIGAHGLQGEQEVPFALTGLAPGDGVPLSVVIRNDADRAAQITYEGAVVRRGTLASQMLLTVKQGERVLASGPANAARLPGATMLLAPASTSRLTLVLNMPRETGNLAQGRRMDVVFRFAISGGDAGGIATGVATPDALPPTGESLGLFHALVWAALATFGLLLVLVAAHSLQRARGARPTEVSDDSPGVPS